MPRRNLAERLAARRVLKPCPVAGLAGHCWVWTGSLVKRPADPTKYRTPGYGRIVTGGRHILVHRAAWELWRGSIPSGLTIDHLCKVKACFNPDHLEPVTRAENRRRERRAMCGRGQHAMIDANVYIDPRGYRQCRACRTAAVRRHRSAVSELSGSVSPTS